MNDRQAELIVAMLRLFKEYPDLSTLEKVEALGSTFAVQIAIAKNESSVADLAKHL